MTDLQTLLDDHEIRHLAFRYCRALDTKDWALLDDVFVPDATAELGAPTLLTGIEEIRGRIRAALGLLDDSQHLVGNHEIDVDGDTATHRCYLQAQHIRAAADGGPNYLVGGRYDDRLVRTADGWRIVHRTLTVMWTDGNVDVVHPR
jgi:hypothetical protein